MSDPNDRLEALLPSVVSVVTVSDAPDYEQPWQTTGPRQSSGSGAIIETAHGKRVLTNAHCAENAVFIEVRRYGHSTRFVAHVEAIGHECDLAILTVDDPAFYEGANPLPIGELPHLGDKVQVCGFPIGGERLSVTEGLVSRIELVHYAQAQRRLLAVQIDAAINSGNSGGPVLKDGVLVGVAFQSLVGADRIGQSIAAPVVKHFIEDVADGVYDGFPAVGVTIQRLESKAHRRFLGLPDALEGGVIVLDVVYGGSAWGILEKGDVLLEVSGVPIASDGTVPLRGGERVGFDYVVSRAQIGEPLSLKVSRAGEVHDCALTLKDASQLVAEDRYEVPPSYYVVGGLLLVPLTRDYLKTWGTHFWHDAPRDLVLLYERGLKTPDRHQPVVLQKVLADRINQGFHDFANLLVEKAQGVPVRSLTHLVELIEDGDGAYIELDLAGGRRVVLARDEAVERHGVILERFGVPADRSSDLPRFA